MPRLNRSWSESSICRIDWQPSRWLVAALIALTLLSAASIGLSDASAGMKWLGALLALGHGLRLAHREWRRPRLTLAWAGGAAPARISVARVPVELARVRVEQRGTMAVLWGHDRDGRCHRLVWWPDTLPSAERRQLRLAAQVSARYDKPLPPVAA